MKRYIALILAIVCILALAGCGSHTEKDYPAAIMAEGEIYLKSAAAMPAEIDESAIIGYTTSYTDTYPEKDGETNFNRELNMPYAKVEGGIAVLYENEWYLCTPKDENAGSGGGTISFYSEPTRENTEPAVVDCSSISKKQAKELRRIIDDVDEWIDDHSVDRLAYYFDGHIEFSGDKTLYYFTYEYNVIYYNHYFAEIPLVADLARCVTSQCQAQFFLGDASTVIGHGDAFDTSGFQAHLDTRGARINRVLHEFFHNGRRPLDDFTGGNLTDQLIR